MISSSELPDCHGQPTYEEQRLNVFNLTAVQSKATDFFPQVASKRNYDNQRAFARGLEATFPHFFFLQTSLNLDFVYYVLLLK